MPSVGKPDERGDLYATVDVQLPKTLTPKQREHYEALAQMQEQRRPEASHEHQQIHGEGPGSGRRGAAARRES